MLLISVPKNELKGTHFQTVKEVKEKMTELPKTLTSNEQQHWFEQQRHACPGVRIGEESMLKGMKVSSNFFWLFQVNTVVPLIKMYFPINTEN